MKTVIASMISALMALAGVAAAAAAELKDEVRVQIQTASVHADMAPGTYVCAEGHFHVKGTVQNLAAVPVGAVKVAGRALDADGKVLGTATASTKRATLNPKETADVNLEFLTITGPLIKQVKSQTLEVVAVSAKP